MIDPADPNENFNCELPDHHEADDDIRAGRTKTFNDIDDLIGSLREPWETNE